ncbi:Efflux pump roqT [Talaromyces pinophilus]|nr:Efflux pump roqT [Talaromyces pinophilus]
MPTKVPSPAPPKNDHIEKQSLDFTNTTASDKTRPADETIAQDPSDVDSDPQYPSGLKLFFLVIGLALAVLCVAIDNTIIATAIPRITDHFHALSDIGWYGSAYLVTLSTFLLFFGRLYVVFNIKWIFMLSLFLFELGSLICGLAPTSTALIVGRAIAGLGSAGLYSGSLIILAFSTPMHRRPLFTSLMTSVYAIASVVGPLLGGIFTDHVTWRWCFYINLPIGGITAIAIFLFYKAPSPQPQPKRTWIESIARFDPLGTILFMPSIICLLIALQWGGTIYSWSNGRIIALFVVFGVLLLAFIAVQFRVGDNAIIPIRIARQRSIACGALYALCVGASFFTMVYYIPLWFQAIHGTSATHSGIDTLPMMIAVIMVNITAGYIVSKWGYYTPFMYGLVVVGSIGAGLLTTWTVDTSTGKWIGYQIIFGAGIGMGMQQAMITAQSVLPLADVPIGTCIMQFFQMFGGSLFVSVGQNTFTNHLISRLTSIAGIDSQQIVNAGATQLTTLIHDPNVMHQVQVAYNGALTRTFQVALIMNCLAALGAAGVKWRSVKAPAPRPETA